VAPPSSTSWLQFPLPDLPPLSGDALEKAARYLEIAREVAESATCLRSKCGSVVVSHGRILGTGANSLPGGSAPTTCCKDDGSLSPTFKSDATCCTHAEVRAITNALKAGEDVRNSDLYFTRLRPDGTRSKSGAPYCTICSKFAVETGVGLFVLEHEFGVVAYPTALYNQLSFSYAFG
jgi:deoxycytidylate deaminase